MWAIDIYPLLQTQVFIDKFLYFYIFDPEKTEAQKERHLQHARSVIASRFPFVPFVREKL